MADRVSDRRPKGWFWLNNDIVKVFGPLVGPNALAVYVVLACHADGENKAFPGIKRIMTLAKIGSHNTVQAAVQTLVKYHLLKVDGGNQPGVKTTSNVYTLIPVEEALEWLSSLSNNDMVNGVSMSNADMGPCQNMTGAMSNADMAYIKETQVKDLSSSYEEDDNAARIAADVSAETVPEKTPAAKPYNYVKSYIDIWREVFPGEADPDLPGRYTATLRRRGIELTPPAFEQAVRAYFRSDHYQAVQGGHNVKTFCDYPADTWTRGKSPRPPSARPASLFEGSLDDQKEAMRKMRQGT